MKRAFYLIILIVWLLALPFSGCIGLYIALKVPIWQTLRTNLVDSYFLFFKAFGSPSFKFFDRGHAVVGCVAHLAIACLIWFAIRAFINKKERRLIYGDAGFATFDEIKAIGLIRQNDENGILLGQFEGKFLNYGGNQFVALCAPTRSGKGVSIVIPNLLNWKESVVCLDIKGENFNATAGFRAKYQTVYKFDPFNESGNTAFYNPLACVPRNPFLAISELQTIARSLYPPTDKDPIWNDSACNLFVGAALYLIDSNSDLTIYNVMHTANHLAKLTNEMWQTANHERIQNHEPLSHITFSTLNTFYAAPDVTRTSILSTFNAALTLFHNTFVIRATSRSDFDLSTLRKEAQSIYVCVSPNHLTIATPLLNLFFEQLLQINTKVLPAQDPSLKFKALILLDEFTSMGRIPMIAKAVSYIAGYNLRLVLIYQSKSQLASVYGEDDARTIVTNCGCQLYFTPREDKDAQEYSDSLGTYTALVLSRSLSHAGLFGKGLQISKSYTEQSRYLMLPQEIKQMGMQKLIINVEASLPIMADKFKYYAMDVFKERLLPPPANAVSLPPAKRRLEQQAQAQAQANSMQASREIKDMGKVQLLDQQNRVLLEKPSNKKLEGE